MDTEHTERIRKALNDFALALADKPKWVGLMEYEGDFLIDIGELAPLTGNKPNKQDVIRETQNIALKSIDGLSDIDHGILQISIHLTENSAYAILNIIDHWLLCISYHGLGEGCCCKSFDALIDTAMDNYQRILEAI
jgi:hypothetical protein